MGEGNGKLRNILTVIIISLSVIGTFTGYVVANDQQSRKRDSFLDQRLDKVETNYGTIETKLYYIEVNLAEQKVLSEKILAKVG